MEIGKAIGRRTHHADTHHIRRQYDDRRRKTAIADGRKKCVAHGIRVQNSVFECILDSTQFKLLKHELEQTIDPASDSLRFYTLGNNYQSKVTHIGAKETYELEGDLIL